MKKNQRNFAVEYKNGRRRAGSNTNSIWGDVDLRQVAKEVQIQRDLPVVLPAQETGAGVTAVAAVETGDPMLTPVESSQNSSSSYLKESRMNDEIDSTADSATAPAVAAPETGPKARKPRGRKSATQIASSDATNNETAEKPKRGRKPKAAGTSAAGSRQPRGRRAAVAPQPATSEPTSTTDDFSDLLQLEEENRALRKQLAEKLRAENAELKKRLNLN
ncbi:transcriptional regulator [Rhizobium halophilum]|uniref:transcriptional regulator n=1 Tax=Rhizobium halophilum TaxID=2846852 RepID=UPI001EFD22CC|nr:transcriptional regulator [Rhizobium halophilum]MCF6371037.1 transcriptional regulator [Rhizobium halophilum]